MICAACMNITKIDLYVANTRTRCSIICCILLITPLQTHDSKHTSSWVTWMSALWKILPLPLNQLQTFCFRPSGLLRMQLPVVPCCSKLEPTGGKWLLLAHNISGSLRPHRGGITESKKEIRSSLPPEPFSAEGEHVFYTHTTGIH